LNTIGPACLSRGVRPLHAMRTFTAILLLSVLMLPSLALAKRIPAPKVESIVHEGVRYVAPNDKGTDAYVEAWDVATGKRLWKKTVFTTWINPIKEHCIQWVFIREMRREDGHLVISSERGKSYSLDLKTKRVRKLKTKE
jgi:hypothetical protein